MKNIRLTLTLLLLSVVFSACQKQVYEIVDVEEEKLAGIYNVSKYRVTVYDPTGKQLSQTDYPDYGSVELIMNSNKGGDVFSHFIFYGPVRFTYVPSKVNTGQYCGDQNEAQQKFGVYYQCDPSKKRILIAAICPMQTLNYFVDYMLDGDQFEMFTRAVDPSTQNQTFYEYFFTRK